jgi:exosortase
MSVETKNGAVSVASSEMTGERPGLLAWPRSAWLCGLLLVAIYGPMLQETSHYWFQNDNFAHGMFIVPLSVGLLWLQRSQIAAATTAPTARGLLWLAIGLLIGVFSYLMRVKFIGIWTVIPTLAGTILVLHGPELWEIARFPICFLFWAGPLPSVVYSPISQWVQTISTRGAAELMITLGYTLMRNGNQIQIPGYALEVADACSGFKKLIALTAFALLYGYIYPISPLKRLILVLCALPIALVANVLRVSALVAVFSASGLNGLHRAHDIAEMCALFFSFILFVVVGKALGCKIARFSL